MCIVSLVAERTDLVELDDVGLCALLAEEGLCGLAVRAVGLGEDGHGVLVDDALHLCLGGGHCGRRGGAAEEAAEDGGNGCGFFSLS